MIRFRLLVFFVFLSAVHIAYGEELPDKFMLRAGYYNISEMNTRFNVGRGGGFLGTNINYSRDLSGEDREAVGKIFGYYRFNDRHRINYGWLKVKRTGEKALAFDVNFGGQTFTVGSTVESFIETEFSEISYQYSFFRNEKVELGVSAGLYALAYSIGLRGTVSGIEEIKDATAPLPVVGYHMDYAIYPRWHVLMDIDMFHLSVEDKYKGSMINFQLATEYRILPNLALGMGANSAAVNVDVDAENLKGAINDSYKGYEAYGALYF